MITVKLCSRDPAPPPIEYVKGGGGIFKVGRTLSTTSVLALTLTVTATPNPNPSPSPTPEQDMAVHDLDMARFLMGCEPVKVLAMGSCQVSAPAPAPLLRSNSRGA